MRRLCIGVGGARPSNPQYQGRCHMSGFRFVLLAAGLFALMFVGGTWGVPWAKRGFPVMTNVVPLKPDASIPTFNQAVKEGQRRDWVNSKTNQSDGNVARDNVRQELLAASTAYSLSPCDETMRKNFIAALSNYTQAWYDLAFCKPGAGECPRNADQRLEAANASFKTPADANVQKALREALGQGGISMDDFPSALRRYIFLSEAVGMFGVFGSSTRACHAPRKAVRR
jgi:hypothetical protein